MQTAHWAADGSKLTECGPARRWVGVGQDGAGVGQLLAEAPADAQAPHLGGHRLGESQALRLGTPS